MIRAAAEGAALGIAFAAAAGMIWTQPALVAGVRFGVAAAWAASTASVTWLLWARERSTGTFWGAFGGGMLLRGIVLGGLFLWGLRRAGTSMEALLISYGLALLGLMLTLEIRHLRLRTDGL